MDTVLFDSLLARDLKSWERAGRTGSGRPSSRKMAGKPLTKSGISIIRGHLSDCTRDLPAGSQPAGSQPTGTHVPVEILLVQDFIFVLPFFTLAYLKSRTRSHDMLEYYTLP